MIIGFTGTRDGMKQRQRDKLLEYLSRQCNEPVEFHHGDCNGADEEAHFMALKLGMRIVIHPPMYDRERAFCQSKHVREPKHYIERNHDIVAECDILLATPKTIVEQERSGTWATIRFARGLTDKHIVIIFPNGTVTERLARIKPKFRVIRRVPAPV